MCYVCMHSLFTKAGKTPLTYIPLTSRLMLQLAPNASRLAMHMGSGMLLLEISPPDISCLAMTEHTSFPNNVCTAIAQALGGGIALFC